MDRHVFYSCSLIRWFVGFFVLKREKLRTLLSCFHRLRNLLVLKFGLYLNNGDREQASNSEHTKVRWRFSDKKSVRQKVCDKSTTDKSVTKSISKGIQHASIKWWRHRLKRWLWLSLWTSRILFRSGAVQFTKVCRLLKPIEIEQLKVDLIVAFRYWKILAFKIFSDFFQNP